MTSVLALVALAGLGCAKPIPDVTTDTEGSGSESTSAETSGGTTAGSTTGAMSTTSGDTGPVDSGTVTTGTEPVCGDGVIDEGEACDGEMLPPMADCAARGFGDGIPACSADCTMLDYTVCPAHMACGNGELGLKEECDGTNLGGLTCNDFPNLTGRGLVCTDECQYDTSACIVCRESGESCTQSDTCCNADEVCSGLSPHCCVLNGLGLCSN